MEKKVWFEDKHGNKLCGVLHTPEGKGPFPAVVLVHGLNTSKDGASARMSAKHIFNTETATLSIDLYGHGESDGVFEDVTVTSAEESIYAALDFLSIQKNINVNKIGLFGSSYGGSASIAAGPDPRIKAIVLKTPASDYKDIRIFKLGKNEMLRWKKEGIITTLGQYTLKWSFHQDVLDNHRNQYAEANKIKAPTLIIHGDEDTIVPLDQSKRLLAALGGVKNLEILSGAGHIIRDTKFLSKVNNWTIDWFKKYL